MESKNNTHESIYKTNRLTDIENKLMVLKWRVWEGYIKRKGLTDTNYYIKNR